MIDYDMHRKNLLVMSTLALHASGCGVPASDCYMMNSRNYVDQDVSEIVTQESIETGLTERARSFGDRPSFDSRRQRSFDSSRSVRRSERRPDEAIRAVTPMHTSSDATAAVDNNSADATDRADDLTTETLGLCMLLLLFFGLLKYSHTQY